MGKTGNTNPDERGLALGRGGKAAPPGRKLSGRPEGEPKRSITDPDTDGHSIGGRS